MKGFLLLLASFIVYTHVTAQTDTIPIKKDSLIKVITDTISVANFNIIKHHNKKEEDVEIILGRKHKQRSSNVSTNWWIFDIGFANYVDITNYNNTGAYLVNRPGSIGLGEDDFKLRAGKSINVNIWFFMQRLNIVKHIINLKYGFGLELNNYRYNSSISYKQDGVVPYTNPVIQSNSPFIFRDSISFSKNKLAADYLTVPLMLNFATNARHPGKSFMFSAGISAGYLYSQRNKQVSPERGKQKNKGDYDLEPFKLSYIGEIGLGRIRLYGSYSPSSFYQKALDMKPYTFGIRLSNW